MVLRDMPSNTHLPISEFHMNGVQCVAFCLCFIRVHLRQKGFHPAIIGTDATTARSAPTLPAGLQGTTILVNNFPADAVELGVVYGSVEGVNENSFDECLEQLKHKAHALGATAVVGLQLVQSQFQWNQRTSLLATAIK